MLYLVATPIGNLEDITFRAVKILKECDYILCEDTRHSHTLLAHYDIKKPLKSFHKFSEATKEESVIEDLLSGLKIALISDAGTPGISDPGTRLVQKCIENNIDVVSIPGACAAIAAVACSGLDTDRFQFLGFLPRKTGEIRHILQEILSYPGTTICYEAPNRLVAVLEKLHELSPNKEVVIARELTKKFEEIVRGPAAQLAAQWQEQPPKGEIVLLIAGEKKKDLSWESLSPEEHVKMLEETYAMTRNEAIKMAAQMRGVSKRDIYNKIQKK